MADPVTWVYIIGTVVAAGTAVASADATRRAQHANADNARMAAKIGIDQGDAQAATQARQSRAQLDAARAQYGASGVDENEGSPLDVMQSSAMNASLDNATIKYNAKVRAFGYGNEANSYDTSASAATQKGQWEAGSDILSGGSKAYAASYTPSVGRTQPSTGRNQG